MQTTPNPAPQAARTRAGSTPDERALLPRVDVIEDERGITVLADMPGVPKDRLDINVDGDRLLIEGEIAPLGSPELQPVHAEVGLARWRRAFTLSRELDTTAIDAKLKDGVLTLRIPKQAHAQPRRIAVQAG